jgi:hypothetical protein
MRSMDVAEVVMVEPELPDKVPSIPEIGAQSESLTAQRQGQEPAELCTKYWDTANPEALAYKRT